MASSKEIIARVPTEPRTRHGNQMDRVQRIPFGMGKEPSAGAAAACLNCGFGNVPVIEEVIWTVVMPMKAAEVTTTFGDVINLFNPTGVQPGVATIDSTFLVNGILQTDLWCEGIGIHIFVEPLAGTQLGNGWTTPTVAGSPPPSWDVWTSNDLANGAFNTVTSGLTPATIDWGTDAQEAAWNFANAYQLQLRTNQRELMINEQLADVSYMASFGEFQAAGTSEDSVIQKAALVNAQYRLKASPTIFLPADFRRYGSVTVAGVNVGVAHATRDYDTMIVTRGGPKVQGMSCGGGMYRKIEKPCYFERGIPIGPQFVANDPVHLARFQAAMAIDDLTGSQNLQPDVNVTGFTLGAVGGANTSLEQTLDSNPVNVSQQIATARQVYKGGIFKVGVKLKGWEMPGKWKKWCSDNMPQLLNQTAPGSGSTVAAST